MNFPVPGPAPVCGSFPNHPESRCVGLFPLCPWWQRCREALRGHIHHKLKETKSWFIPEGNGSGAG